MKGIPKQSEGAPARPVQTPWGPRPDVSGDGASPLLRSVFHFQCLVPEEISYLSNLPFLQSYRYGH